MEPVRRRRRPAVSCSQCRARKIRCNRENPCNNCAKSKTAVCDYGNQNPLLPAARNRGTENPTRQPGSVIGPGRGLEPDQESHAPSSNSRSGINTPTSTQQSSSPAFSSTTLTPTITKTAFTGLSDAFYVHYEQESAAMCGVPQHIPRSVSHKTRLFGQSHWVSPSITLFRDLIEILERGNVCRAFADVQRCKSLARLIKARRSPTWPTLPTRELPPRDIADSLVDCYLQTTETVYRVLHIPTFKKSYNALWLGEGEPDMAFVIQVKLVMAIGTIAYDDDFSLRTSAIRWTHEAIVWNSGPDDFKSRLTIQGLQNHILLLLAQAMVGVGRDMVWPATGFLVRTAIHMGLHRDPSRLQPRITLHAAEMRRRLWNTIIELTLQSSLNNGSPVLLSLDDFDTSPPSNYDDVDLESPEPIPPAPPTTVTQCTIPIAFRRTFPQRLAIAKFLNGLPLASPEGPYAETLALDASLHEAYRTLTHSLRSCAPSLAILYIDLLTRRYLSALHVPFLEAALTSSPQSKFLYSRNAALDNALRIWNTTRSPDPLFARFASNGATFLRAASVQAIFVAAAELRAQLLAERDSLVPPVVRTDLIAVIEHAVAWALRCIEVGETNVKGYLFLCLVRAQIEALRQRVSDSDLPALLVRAAEEAGATCLPLLERMLEKVQGEGVVEVGEVDFDNVTMSDFLFGFENAETMSWDFR